MLVILYLEQSPDLQESKRRVSVRTFLDTGLMRNQGAIPPNRLIFFGVWGSLRPVYPPNVLTSCFFFWGETAGWSRLERASSEHLCGTLSRMQAPGYCIATIATLLSSLITTLHCTVLVCSYAQLATPRVMWKVGVSAEELRNGPDHSALTMSGMVMIADWCGRT